jgi:hypothetical protein
MAKRAMKPPPSRARVRRVRARTRHFIVELSTFEGEYTACYLLGAEPMWIVISASPTAGASIVDWGYPSLKEAREAWPEAVAPAPERRPASRFIDAYRPVFSEPWFQDFWKKLKRENFGSAR